LCGAEPGLTYTYTNSFSSVQYVLNTTRVNWYEAEDTCMSMGGHLISYSSIEEQLDVEAYFAASSGLLATYTLHK
jgi:hypothetical protein